MRRWFFLFIVWFTVALSAIAQSSRISFIAKGGMTSYMPYKDLIEPAPLGEHFGLEGSYTFMWPLPYRNEVGIRFGLHIAYGSPNMRIPESFEPYQYTNVDYLGNQIDYTIHVNRAKQEIQQFQVGVPIMAAGVSNRIFWSAGFRVMFPFALQYEQTLDADISAFYPEFGVEVPNELVTGKLNENKHFRGKTSLPNMYLQVGGEASYRLYYKRPRTIFQPSQAVYLGVFAYFTIASSAMNTNPEDYLVLVKPIETAPPAEVVVKPINEVLSPKLFPFEIGLTASFDITYSHRYNSIRHHSRHILFRP